MDIVSEDNASGEAQEESTSVAQHRDSDCPTPHAAPLEVATAYQLGGTDVDFPEFSGEEGPSQEGVLEADINSIAFLSSSPARSSEETDESAIEPQGPATEHLEDGGQPSLDQSDSEPSGLSAAALGSGLEGIVSDANPSTPTLTALPTASPLGLGEADAEPTASSPHLHDRSLEGQGRVSELSKTVDARVLTPTRQQLGGEKKVQNMMSFWKTEATKTGAYAPASGASVHRLSVSSRQPFTSPPSEQMPVARTGVTWSAYSVSPVTTPPGLRRTPELRFKENRNSLKLLKAELEERVQCSETLKQQLAARDTEMMQLRSELSSAKAEVAEAERRIYEKQLALKNTQQQVADLKDQLEVKDEDFEALKLELAAAKEHVRERENEVGRVRGELEEARVEAEAGRAREHEYGKDAGERVERLMKEWAASNEQLRSVSAELRTEQHLHQQALDRCSGLEQQVQQLREELGRAGEAAREQAVQHQAALSASQAQAQEQEERAAREQAGRERAEEEGRMASARADSMEQRVCEAGLQLEQAVQQLADLQEMHERDVEKLRSRQRRLKEEKDNSEGSLQQQLEEALGECRRLQGEWPREAQEECSRLRAEVRRLEASVHSQRDEVARSKDEVVRSKEEVSMHLAMVREWQEKGQSDLRQAASRHADEVQDAEARHKQEMQDLAALHAAEMRELEEKHRDGLKHEQEKVVAARAVAHIQSQQVVEDLETKLAATQVEVTEKEGAWALQEIALQEALQEIRRLHDQLREQHGIIEIYRNEMASLVVRCKNDG